MRTSTLAGRGGGLAGLALVVALVSSAGACSSADPPADVVDLASDDLAAGPIAGTTRLALETPTGPVALIGATLVDVADRGRSGHDIEDSVVLISGDRIVAAGPRDEIELPADVQEIDVTGRWIVPGLIDAFATLNDQSYADSYLAMGVTGIVGVGGGRRGELWLQADPGPRVFPLEGIGSDPMESVAEVLGAGPAFLIPTLSLLYLDYEQHANPWKFPVAAWLDAGMINAPADPQTGNHTYDEAHMAAYAEVAAQVLELESQYRAAGASYLAGSATDVWGTMPGISLHTEMEMLTRIGLSPREVLAAASFNIAEALHLDGLGTVAAGNYADLVVVGSDPTLDLITLQQPELVVSAGRLVRWEAR